MQYPLAPYHTGMTYHFKINSYIHIGQSETTAKFCLFECGFIIMIIIEP